MQIKVLEMKTLCGCCLEKTEGQPTILFSQEGTLIIEFPHAQGEGRSTLLHIRYESEAKVEPDPPKKIDKRSAWYRKEQRDAALARNAMALTASTKSSAPANS